MKSKKLTIKFKDKVSPELKEVTKNLKEINKLLKKNAVLLSKVLKSSLEVI
jgi:hypothetical protein